MKVRRGTEPVIPETDAPPWRTLAQADTPSAVHSNSSFNRTRILPVQLTQTQLLRATQTHIQNKPLCCEGTGSSAAKIFTLRWDPHPVNSGHPTCWLGIIFPLQLILGATTSLPSSPCTSSIPGSICQRLSRISLQPLSSSPLWPMKFSSNKILNKDWNSCLSCKF